MLGLNGFTMDAVTMAIVLLGCGFIGFLLLHLVWEEDFFAPLLHYGLDWEIDGALLIVSLGLSATVSWGSGLRHRKEKLVSDERLKQSLLGALPGAISVCSSLLQGSFDIIFKVRSLVCISWAIVKTFRSKANVSQEEAVNLLPLRVGTGAGGMLSSILAIGAGAIYVPVLRAYGGLASRKAIGTSLHIMMIVLPISILTHFVALDAAQMDVLSSNLMLILCMPIVVGISSNLGARFGIAKVSEQRIMNLFALVLIVIGVRYTLDVTSRLF